MTRFGCEDERRELRDLSSMQAFGYVLTCLESPETHQSRQVEHCGIMVDGACLMMVANIGRW